MRLEKDRFNKKQKRAKKVLQSQHEILNQQDYLNMFDNTNNGAEIIDVNAYTVLLTTPDFHIGLLI
jgi:hypothetical protein